MQRTAVKAALLLAPLLLAASLPDENGVNGESYVCSLKRGIECDSDVNCGPPAPQLPPPTFIHVDTEGKLITLLDPPERRGETTQIRIMEDEGDRLIMSGIEAGRTWSMILSKTDHSAAISINLGDAVQVVFAQCIAENQIEP
ncbi:MAG: hypothetical protein JSU87_16465 [Gemmatimonadota bacterium]|nr:MAG: hypothetical protein JSU87_16465 [Gemmatimonadota bacterium]